MEVQRVREVLCDALVENIDRLTHKIALTELINKYGYAKDAVAKDTVAKDGGIWRELIIDLDNRGDLNGFASDNRLFKYLPRIFRLNGKYYIERLYRRRKNNPAGMDTAELRRIVNELLQWNIAIMLDSENIYDDGTGEGLRFLRYWVLGGAESDGIEYYLEYCDMYFNLINVSKPENGLIGEGSDSDG